ncbi:MAG: substrate-binding domain-containing protein [Arthrobacter sp.]|uniref:substrate-binding domain-containing protein n=1 Tax=Arthrobacter sp. TaxID=1667 RepID=UPI003494483B
MAGLKIAYVPGVTPGKWLDRWQDRYPDAPVDAFLYDAGDPLALLAQGRADMVFVRFPDGASPAGPATHVIPLYDELPVVCAPRDHDVELYDDEVPLADVADARFLDLADYPPEAGGAAMAVEVVGTGAGLLVLPMSVAKLYRRKDVVHRVLSGAPVTRIGLAWNRPAGDDPENPLIVEFVGIVRGRAANSSRQPSVQERQQEEAAKALKKRQSGAAKAAGAAAKSGGKSGGKSGPRGAARSGRTGGPRKSGGAGRGRR